MTTVLVLNGPNLNLLGTREPGIYGDHTLADIEALVRGRASELDVRLEWVQSNHEGELVDLVQRSPTTIDGLIVNLGAYSHTSLALRDAFLATSLPFVEVHISNIFAREAARHHSVVADLAVGMIAGLGPLGYSLALEALVDHLART